METRIVIRDNQAEMGLVIDTELLPREIRFLNELGERISQATEYEISVVAVEPGA